VCGWLASLRYPYAGLDQSKVIAAMGAAPSHRSSPAPPRVRKILAAVVVPMFVLTAAAAILLWPTKPGPPVEADPVSRHSGTVVKVVEQACPETGPEPDAPPGVTAGPCGTVTVKVNDGPGAGRQVDTDIPSGPGAPKVAVGNEIILVQLADPTQPDNTAATRYTIVDHQRGNALILVVVLFAAAIVGFGRWRGLAALAGLAASFTILLAFVVPAIRAGQSPLAVAVVGAALIMFVVLYLTHGITVQTSVAVLGTLASLVLTGVLGLVAISVSHLTGFGSEEATTLSLFQGAIDLRGLLLAGIIIGSLGVLDDVTVTQAATVTELAAANPGMSGRQLYRAATRVGRAHIASVVNTIVLAYAGASLPVLLLIVASGTTTSATLTSEFIAQEIIRSAVATIGLIAAVPITTALAALVTAGMEKRHRTRRTTAPVNRREQTLAALSQPHSGDPWTDPADA